MSPQARHLLPLHERLMIEPFKWTRYYDDTASSESGDNLLRLVPQADSIQRFVGLIYLGQVPSRLRRNAVMFPLMAD
jgi:hypothetical protein